MRYDVFVVWNALGRITWGDTFWSSATSPAFLTPVASTIGKRAAVVIALLVIAGCLGGVSARARQRVL